MPPITRFPVSLLLVLAFASTPVAAARYAVFKSTDRGRSWIRSDAGMPARSRVNAFGSGGEVLLVGTDSGIFISGDEARSWRPATGAAMSSGRIVSFATWGPEAYAGTDGGGILVSTDQGKSWARDAAFPSKKVRCLLVHEDRLYAGTDEDGVFVLDDNGRAWTPIRQGLPDQAQVFALSAVEGRLFAGLYSKGLYARDGHEGHWTKAGSVVPLVVATVGVTLVAGHNPGGLFWSGDLGASWSKGVAAGHAVGPLMSSRFEDAGELPSEAPVWELGSNDEGLVLAGAAAGIYSSEDRGRTWSRARKGLPEASPGIAFLLKRDLVLAGTQLAESDCEPRGAANGSRPVGSETKRTSSAAGSRR